MNEIKSKKFDNGVVYLLKTDDGYPVEVTDTHLPVYTKNAVTMRNNRLVCEEFGSRTDRWMIGVSVMSGCPVRCKFCATGMVKNWRRLTADEIVDQVKFVLDRNEEKFTDAVEHKINYTRMGEPFLNIGAVKRAIEVIEKSYPNTHHYVSTIGINDSDFGFVKDNITLQISLHSLDTNRRDELIPYKNKMSIPELGCIRTESRLKTTLNLTLVDESDFDISTLVAHFPKEHFFVKLSPINPNVISKHYGLGEGVVK